VTWHYRNSDRCTQLTRHQVAFMMPRVAALRWIYCLIIAYHQPSGKREHLQSVLRTPLRHDIDTPPGLYPTNASHSSYLTNLVPLQVPET